MSRDPDRSVPARARPGRRLLELARDGSEAARAQLATLAPEAIVDELHALEPDERVEALACLPHVEEVVPLIPEAEWVHTLRTVGLADAGWLVEFASGEQRVAAVDLDCWKDGRFSPSRFNDWLDALIEAGHESLVAAFEQIDVEVWLLALGHMAEFRLAAGDDGNGFESDGWPEGLTEDGVVFYEPRSSDDESRVQEILRAALQYAPSFYWAFAYGAMSESHGECEQYAERWHAGRMNDLGFPDREQAMRAYRPLRVDATPVVDVGADAAPTGALMPVEALPQQLAGTLVGRALRELPPDRASEILGSVLGVANSLAVADALPLADTGSVERSLRKALRGIDAGLAAIARANDRPASAVLNQTPALDLFRVGATLDPELRRGRGVDAFEGDLERADWAVEEEVLGDADRVLGPDGRPR